MRPWLETVVIPADRSWLLFDRRLPSFPFNWHYHPEFELTLTLDSEGMRFVGDHAERYEDGDLVLVGPNLPHAWQSSRTTGAPVHRALVCWFTEAWISSLIEVSPELGPLRGLLETSRNGVVFAGEARERAGRRLLALVGATPQQHWLGLLDVLMMLCADPARATLATTTITPPGNSRERLRLAQVLDWLNDHYTEPVDVEHLAELAHVSTSQLQRLFKRSTRMSISAYVMQRRIGHACALLAQGNLTVAGVGERVGYREPAYFARQFSAMKGCTPSEYRRHFASANREVQQSRLKTYSFPE